MPPKNNDAPIASDKPTGLDLAALARQMEELTKTNAQLQQRLDALSEGGKVAKAKEIVLTKEGEYVASSRGHIPGLGIIEPGKAIPADIPVGSWMKKASKKKKAEAEAEVEDEDDGLDDD